MPSRLSFAIVLAFCVLASASMFLGAFNTAFGQEPQTVMCRVKWVHDGDMFRCDGYTPKAPPHLGVPNWLFAYIPQAYPHRMLVTFG